MDKDYTRYSIAVDSQEQRDILIAVLEDWGIEGFEETDDSLFASGNSALIDESEIDKYLEATNFPFQKSVIPDQNWNALWEANFDPVRVDDFVAIRASFHEPAGGVLHEIIITPKMSFGTGHHATTHLVIQLMRNIDFTGASVFDFGTGTGILAILAEKLGAQHVIAVDYDDWCILNAQENVDQNTCKKIVIQKGEVPPGDAQFDVVLANINKNIILENMSSLVAAATPAGFLVISGLLLIDQADMEAAALEHHLKLLTSVEKNGWIAMFFQKHGLQSDL